MERNMAEIGKPIRRIIVEPEPESVPMPEPVAPEREVEPEKEPVPA